MSDLQTPEISSQMQNSIPPALQRGEVPSPSDESEYIVSYPKLQETLKKQNLTLTGERTPLSRGIHGPLYILKTTKGQDIVEVTFTMGGKPKDIKKGKNFLITDTSTDSSLREIRTRLGIVNPITSEVDRNVIDWVYNDEQALKALQDIPGIPHFYGSVKEGTKGSILMEKIEGYDLFNITEHANAAEIMEIFDKIVSTYCQAAERGYIYNNPVGSTIMVDSATNQPYLTDWYSHLHGSITTDEKVRKKFLDGIDDINRLKGVYLSLYYESNYTENENETTQVNEAMDRTSVYAQADTLAFNPGHTAALQKAVPGLIESGTLHELDSQKLLSIPSQRLIEFLKDHKKDQPYAVAEVVCLISEELRQRPDPNTGLKGLKADIQELQDLQDEQADDEEIEEVADYVREGKKALDECLQIIPSQLATLQNILQNPEFTELIDDYVKTYKDVKRKNNEVETSQTHAEYVKSLLEEITTSMERQNAQMKHLLDDEYFTSKEAFV